MRHGVRLAFSRRRESGARPTLGAALLVQVAREKRPAAGVDCVYVAAFFFLFIFPVRSPSLSSFSLLSRSRLPAEISFVSFH